MGSNEDLWYFLYASLPNKHSGCWWFERPWRACDIIVMIHDDHLDIKMPSYDCRIFLTGIHIHGKTAFILTRGVVTLVYLNWWHRKSWFPYIFFCILYAQPYGKDDTVNSFGVQYDPIATRGNIQYEDISLSAIIEILSLEIPFLCRYKALDLITICSNPSNPSFISFVPWFMLVYSYPSFYKPIYTVRQWHWMYIAPYNNKSFLTASLKFVYGQTDVSIWLVFTC